MFSYSKTVGGKKVNPLTPNIQQFDFFPNQFKLSKKH